MNSLTLEVSSLDGVTYYVFTSNLAFNNAQLVMYTFQSFARPTNRTLGTTVSHPSRV